MASKNSNLSNPASEPEHAPITVTCEVHFDPHQGAFPRTKLLRWLESLPEDARIAFTGIGNGKTHFAATWKETR